LCQFYYKWPLHVTLTHNDRKPFTTAATLKKTKVARILEFRVFYFKRRRKYSSAKMKLDGKIIHPAAALRSLDSRLRTWNTH
jgi:hypothetical protein